MTPHPLIGRKVWITTPPTYYGSKEVVSLSQSQGQRWTPREGKVTAYDPLSYRKGYNFFVYFPSLSDGWWYPESEINSFINICQEILNEDTPNAST